MKRALLIAPFILLALLSLASRWVEGGRLLGNIWAASFLACFLIVPLAARHRLWLGYAALVYPFVVLGLQVGLDWGSLKLGF